MTAQSVSEAAATVRRRLRECGGLAYYENEALTALSLLVERAERAASLEARMAYIASEYDCYCETPGTSNDCAVCEVRAAIANQGEDAL